MTTPPAEKRVLFAFTSSDLYGAELSLLPVVRRLDPSWKRYLVVSGAGSLETFLKKEGFTVYRLPLGQRKVGRALRRLQLMYLLYSRRIELVHVNLHMQAHLIWQACSILRIPIVVHVRNMIEQPVANSFRKFDGIICISQAVRNSLVTQGRVPLTEIAERLWIIPDGRELAPFRIGNRDRVRRELRLDPATPLVGMAARITPMKGQDTFLRMAALVKKQVPEARFLLAGAPFGEEGNQYLQELQALVGRLGLQNDVIFAGYRDDMHDILAAMDCFVHPSRRGAFVSVLIEAMASGLPIIASDVDGIPECVGRDGAAVLLPPDDPAAWADAIVRIITDKNLANHMAARERERASSLFDIAPLAQQTTEVLKTVCEGHHKHGHSWGDGPARSIQVTLSWSSLLKKRHCTTNSSRSNADHNRSAGNGRGREPCRRHLSWTLRGKCKEVSGVCRTARSLFATCVRPELLVVERKAVCERDAAHGARGVNLERIAKAF
jgi:glycosyltransferase involved in cell wall biosynthesis